MGFMVCLCLCMSRISLRHHLIILDIHLTPLRNMIEDFHCGLARELQAQLLVGTTGTQGVDIHARMVAGIGRAMRHVRTIPTNDPIINDDRLLGGHD